MRSYNKPFGSVPRERQHRRLHRDAPHAALRDRAVTSLCRRYGVTPAGFYAWCRRGVSAHAEQDRVLSQEIGRRFTQHAARYGSPRIHQLLVRAGWRVSRRRVARLMRT